MTPEVLLLRATIWLSVLAWVATEGLNATRPNRRVLARALWTSGALLLAVHTVVAFEFWHGWSHAAAYAATARQSAALTGVAAGWGIFLNYAFVLVWLADAACGGSARRRMNPAAAGSRRLSSHSSCS